MMDEYNTYKAKIIKDVIKTNTGLNRRIACYYGIAGLLVIDKDNDEDKLWTFQELCRLAFSNEIGLGEEVNYPWSEKRMAQLEVVSMIENYLSKSDDSVKEKFARIRNWYLDVEIPEWAKIGRKVKYQNQYGTVIDNSVTGLISVRLSSGMTVLSGVGAFKSY